MKNLKMIIKLLSMHKLANICIIVEVCLTLFALTLMFNRYNDAFEYYSAFKGMAIDNSIYYMGSIPVWNDKAGDNESPIQYATSYSDEIEKFLSEQPEYIGKSSIIPTTIDISKWTQRNGFSSLYVYDEITAKNFDRFWSTGKLYESNFLSGKIPCVIYENTNKSGLLHVGQNLSAEVAIINSSGDQCVNKMIDFQVVAIVNRESLPAFSPTAGGTTEMRLDSLFAQSEDYVVFAPNIESVFGEVESPTYMIYLNENITQNRLETIVKELDKYGYSTTISDMLKTTKGVATDKLNSDFSGFAALIGISVLSLISVAFLNAKKLFYRFNIYNLLGCSYHRSFQIYIGYLLSLVFSSVTICLFSIVTYNYFYNQLSGIGKSAKLDMLHDLFVVNNGSGLLAILLCLSIVLVSTCINLIFMKKMKSAISIYKGN